MKDIGPVDYYQCVNCGFVHSKTHQELGLEVWKKLNIDFHNATDAMRFDEKPTNSPPYAEQALMLAIAGKYQIINLNHMLDYARGVGRLSGFLRDLFAIRLPVYDPYIQSKDASIDESELSTYDAVFNSAMFEHVLCRKDLDAVRNLLNPDGVLIIHTVVCERIPKDPDWFYLAPPVHNKSMSVLMEQWGFRSSIYCPKGKAWFLLPCDVNAVRGTVDKMNLRLRSEWFIAKQGFVDYWK